MKTKTAPFAPFASPAIAFEPGFAFESALAFAPVRGGGRPAAGALGPDRRRMH